MVSAKDLLVPRPGPEVFAMIRSGMTAWISVEKRLS
jgi:hypothetical protein